ncbi:sensor histidine kinase [Nocardia stercoris]|uniref:histidine kinase n=2 Tax=Nocardia stercoris TaxID=2483361 RepID=A0A3M2L1C7_9NOCA|nr:sensor histidine kinase [Nocardia stercoris]
MLAALLLALDVPAVRHHPNPAVYLVMSVLIPLPVVVRRVYPRTAAAALLVLAFTDTLIAAVTGQVQGHPALLALGIQLYTLVAYQGRRPGAIYLGFLVADLLLAVRLGHQPLSESLSFSAAYYALCWSLAEFNGARLAYDAEVAGRLAVADYDRDRSAHEAVARERTRIARELHDVVAHAVSVMIVQADGARYALRTDPDTTEQALATIAGTGREALRELRRTVELLRTEHAPELLPQHGTAGLASVVGMTRGAGPAVELELSGELDDVPPEISLGVHRIVQESLTNTVRHAGSGARAWVKVHRRGGEIQLEVTDLPGSHDRPGPRPAITGSGLGLVGMRERVAVLGGTLSAGPHGSGWRVAATIPVDRDGR